MVRGRLSIVAPATSRVDTVTTMFCFLSRIRCSQGLLRWRSTTECGPCAYTGRSTRLLVERPASALLRGTQGWTQHDSVPLIGRS